MICRTKLAPPPRDGAFVGTSHVVPHSIADKLVHMLLCRLRQRSIDEVFVLTGRAELNIDRQVVYPFEEDGGIAKMVANKVAIGPRGEWLLPFWREKGGQDCSNDTAWHGRAGVLISEDLVPHPPYTLHPPKGVL